MAAEVLVVGAGPTGLSLAAVRQHGGVPFRLVDRKARPVAESRALVVHAKTLELFARLGLADRAVAAGCPLRAAAILREGRPAGQLRFASDSTAARTPYPFALVLEQSKTERLLVDALGTAGGQVEWRTELLRVAQVPGGVLATVRRPDGAEETIEAAWVVAADGADSPIRHALGLGFAGATYEQTLFVADVDLDGPLGTEQGYFDVTRDGFLLFFALPGDRRFRIFGTVPADRRERATLAAADLQAILDRDSGLRASVARAHWISVYRTHHRMAERFRSACSSPATPPTSTARRGGRG